MRCSGMEPALSAEPAYWPWRSVQASENAGQNSSPAGPGRREKEQGWPLTHSACPGRRSERGARLGLAVPLGVLRQPVPPAMLTVGTVAAFRPGWGWGWGQGGPLSNVRVLLFLHPETQTLTVQKEAGPAKGSQPQVEAGALGGAEGRTDWACVLAHPQACGPCAASWCEGQSCGGWGCAFLPEAPLSTRCPPAGRHRCLDRHSGVHRPSRAARLPHSPGDRAEPPGRGHADGHACA